ncbi:hypothetical protein BsIDN1_21460 [Bacillus safensis]|uniref:Uncharacterized protein n=1 Tax=Bacillus safensis TaxID=561879 RepID=A0A5S9M6R5_BACIA|nr:hypothetical protein BsIDN1_21460 [Bacillus safensis]
MMNVNQLQSFMQLQALKTLQTDPAQTQMSGGQESNAQASFQSLLQDFLGGSELSRLPLSISAFWARIHQRLQTRNMRVQTHIYLPLPAVISLRPNLYMQMTIN